MDTILPVSKAKVHLLELLRRANEEGTVFTITKRGEADGVVMSYDEYESLLETLDILSDKKLMKRIRQGVKEAKRGELVAYEKVFK